MITQSGAQALRLGQRLGRAEDSGIKIDLLASCSCNYIGNYADCGSFGFKLMKVQRRSTLSIG